MRIPPLYPTLLFVGSALSKSYVDTLNKNQQEVFHYGMETLDAYFDYPYVFSSVRYSAWYGVGLLARNKGDDAKVAGEIFQEVLKSQYKDPTQIWFGTFKNDASRPDPGPSYPPKLYTSYDLNLGLFITTAWIIVLEEFQHLLEPSLVGVMKESMLNATIGDGYRVGGFNGDNLYPVYSNPWLMRVMAATYVGNLFNEHNLTYWGEFWAKEAVDAFDIHETLPEYNSGTYTGVSLYALSLWGYMPKNSTISKHATRIITRTWEDVGRYYNPTLRNLGGAWDRGYGFDMTKYFGIIGTQLAGLTGGIKQRKTALPTPMIGSKHYSDAAIIPLIPLTSKFHDPYVPKHILQSIKMLNHTGSFYAAKAFSPPFDVRSRNYTSYTAPGLSIGGIEVDNILVGGAATSATAFTPGIVLWGTKNLGVGWLSYYPSTSSLSSIVAEDGKTLTIKYPPSVDFEGNATKSTSMTFLISPFKLVTWGTEFMSENSESLPGLKVDVSGNVVEKGSRSFAYGGSNAVNEFNYYNLTYSWAEETLGGETPTIVIGIENLET